jgi:hypothetical protein
MELIVVLLVVGGVAALFGRKRTPGNDLTEAQRLARDLDLAVRMFPSPAMRDLLKHPIRDLADNWDPTLFPDLSKVRQDALRSWIVWWMAESARDACERMTSAVEVMQDQCRGRENEVDVQASFQNLIDGIAQYAQGCIECQHGLLDPKERAREDAFQKTRGR